MKTNDILEQPIIKDLLGTLASYIVYYNTELTENRVEKQNSDLRRGPRSKFGRKYQAHFGISRDTNVKQYKREYNYYRYHHGKCRWEK